MPHSVRGLSLSLLFCLSLSLQSSAVAANLKGIVEKQELPGAAQKGGLNGSAASQKLDGSASGQGLSGGAQSTTLEGGAKTQTLNGSARSDTLTGKASGTVLQGGIRGEATLHSQLKVIPSNLSGGRPSMGAAVGKNAHGITEYSCGQPVAPSFGGLVPNLQQTPQGAPLQSGTGRNVGIIPPISNYVLTPKNGITTYVPGYEVSAPSVQKSLVSFPGYSWSTSQTVTRAGVTSYMHGYEVTSNHTNVTSSGSSLWANFVNSNGGSLGGAAQVRSGVTAWMSGYEVNTISKGLSSTVPDAYVVSKRVTTASGAPAYQVSVNTPRNGLVCWHPGYEVTVETPGLEKTTLGGMWSAPSNSIVTALRATPGKLQDPSDKIFVQTVVGPPPMEARAQLLPGLHVQTCVNWEDWYKRVAHTIYERWQQAEVGPGICKVRVTVKRTRDVSGEITDFQPAPGVERDVNAETAFREAAVKAVNSVYVFDIPEFPQGSDQPEVTFDVQMKRTVDGQAGFNVAGVGSGDAAAKTEAAPITAKNTGAN